MYSSGSQNQCSANVRNFRLAHVDVPYSRRAFSSHLANRLGDHLKRGARHAQDDKDRSVMTLNLLIEQTLNGCQFGLMLFLTSAGLTLVFGIMNLINLAHGSLYMVGAYVGATVLAHTGSFPLAILAAVPAAALFGALIEQLLLRWFYHRSHLDQVLVTFGLIMVINEVVRIAWGPTPLQMKLPAALQGSVLLLPDLHYPTYRLVVLGVSLTVALLLYLLVVHTRAGTWVRAGASDSVAASALGINVTAVFSVVFLAGAGLAGPAGVVGEAVFSGGGGTGG